MSQPPTTSQAVEKQASAESCELESLPWLISSLRRQVGEAVKTQAISKPTDPDAPVDEKT